MAEWEPSVVAGVVVRAVVAVRVDAVMRAYGWLGLSEVMATRQTGMGVEQVLVDRLPQAGSQDAAGGAASECGQDGAACHPDDSTARPRQRADGHSGLSAAERGQDGSDGTRQRPERADNAARQATLGDLPRFAAWAAKRHGRGSKVAGAVADLGDTDATQRSQDAGEKRQCEGFEVFHGRCGEIRHVDPCKMVEVHRDRPASGERIEAMSSGQLGFAIADSVVHDGDMCSKLSASRAHVRLGICALRTPTRHLRYSKPLTTSARLPRFKLSDENGAGSTPTALIRRFMTAPR